MLAQIPQGSNNTNDSRWFYQRVDPSSWKFCAELAAGLPPIPTSIFSSVLFNQTHQYYQKIIDNIKRHSDEAKEPHVNVAIMNAIESLENASHALADATTSQSNTANMLNVAATSLTNAATSLTVAANANNNYSIVFVYDIEEITMLSRNYIAEYMSLFPYIDSLMFYKLIESVLKFAQFTGPGELQEGDVVNIQEAVPNGTETMRRLAPKYDALRQFYDEHGTNGWLVKYELANKFGMGDKEHDLYYATRELQQKLNYRWQSVRRCLKLVNEKSIESPGKCANVVLCREGVGYGVGQLLVTGHSSHIPIENIYSTAKMSKKHVFEKIQKRFGEKCALVYVTSTETSFILRKDSVHVWSVEGTDSIDELHNAQLNHWLK